MDSQEFNRRYSTAIALGVVYGVTFTIGFTWWGPWSFFWLMVPVVAAGALLTTRRDMLARHKFVISIAMDSTQRGIKTLDRLDDVTCKLFAAQEAAIQREKGHRVERLVRNLRREAEVGRFSGPETGRFRMLFDLWLANPSAEPEHLTEGLELCSEFFEFKRENAHLAYKEKKLV